MEHGRLKPGWRRGEQRASAEMGDSYSQGSSVGADPPERLPAGGVPKHSD